MSKKAFALRIWAIIVRGAPAMRKLESNDLPTFIIYGRSLFRILTLRKIPRVSRMDPQNKK